MNEPKVSVVIPCFNEEAFIADALNSVQSQSYQNLEIIVVDNNSSDQTAKIVKNFGDKRIRVVTEKEQGLVFARNRGFKEASGEWILRMDADARLHQDWISHALATLSDRDCLAVSSYAEEYEEKLPRYAFDYFNFIAFTVNRVLGGTRMLFGSAMMLHQSLIPHILKNARMRNDIWEDLDISLNIENTQKTVIKDTPVYISLRRLHTPPVEMIKYATGWTRTYWAYNKMASLRIFMYLLLLFPLLTIVYLINALRIPRVKLFK